MHDAVEQDMGPGAEYRPGHHRPAVEMAPTEKLPVRKCLGYPAGRNERQHNNAGGQCRTHIGVQEGVHAWLVGHHVVEGFNIDQYVCGAEG